MAPLGKVGRLDEPDAWVRTHAYSRALHRHAARPWHRDKGVDGNIRATLEALSKLSAHERKALVLTSLSPLSLADIAREVGLPQAETERALQSATSSFAMSRGVASTDVRLRLDALRAALLDTHWPRSTIVRRAGTARRRTHALVGVAAVVAALLVSGTIVASGGAEPSTLDQESALPGVTVRKASASDAAALDAAHLMTPRSSSATAAASPGARARPPTTWPERSRDAVPGDPLRRTPSARQR